MRSLTRDLREVGGLALEPGEVRDVVGGVRDRQEAIDLEAVGEQVVEDPAVLAAEHAVLRAARRDRGDVVGEQPLQQLERLRAARLDLAHVRDVEDARRFAHGHVLLAHALVLNRHLPAREVDELGPGLDVAVEQGGASERGGSRGSGAG